MFCGGVHDLQSHEVCPGLVCSLRCAQDKLNIITDDSTAEDLDLFFTSLAIASLRAVSRLLFSASSTPRLLISVSRRSVAFRAASTASFALAIARTGTRGISLIGSTYFATNDSAFAEPHCCDSGLSIDSSLSAEEAPLLFAAPLEAAMASTDQNARFKARTLRYAFGKNVHTVFQVYIIMRTSIHALRYLYTYLHIYIIYYISVIWECIEIGVWIDPR